MNKLNKILLVVVVLLLIVLGFVMWKPNISKMFSGSSYYAVYMANGDLYFGKIAWYNSSVLSDVRTIQRQEATGKDQQPSWSLVKFSDVAWGPTGDLRINSKNVMWMTKLGDDSQVVKLINGKQ